MKTTDALRLYGSQAALASALGVRRQAVNRWAKKGIIPEGRAYQLEVLTNGSLKVDQTVYRRSAA